MKKLIFLPIAALLAAACFAQYNPQPFVRSFTSIESLRNFNPNVPDSTVVAEGRQTAGDGGGGVLQYFATASAPTNNTTVFAPFNFPGQWWMIIGGSGTNSTWTNQFTTGSFQASGLYPVSSNLDVVASSSSTHFSELSQLGGLYLSRGGGPDTLTLLPLEADSSGSFSVNVRTNTGTYTFLTNEFRPATLASLGTTNFPWTALWVFAPNGTASQLGDNGTNLVRNSVPLTLSTGLVTGVTVALTVTNYLNMSVNGVTYKVGVVQ